MKPTKLVILTGLLCAALSAGYLASQVKDNKAEVALQAAIKTETVDGNLKSAIEQYKKLAQGAYKPVAARALVRLGGCYEKQGNADARKTYEQVLSKFGDQKDAVAEARARLTALGSGGSAGQQAMRVVWTGPKVDGRASSSSPDGRFFTYPDWDTGNLALHDLSTGADRFLTNDGAMKADPDYADVSAVSRDGQQVAYGWEDSKTDHYELRVLRLNGDSTPRRVFANPDVDYVEPRDWSPDGKWIAVLLAPPKSQAEQIGLIAAQDGSLRLLKSGTAQLGIGGFSPDGRYLLYTDEAPPTAKSFIMSVGGNTEVPLVSGTSSAFDPVWTPDGSRIVFVSDLSGSPGLWSTRVVDGKPLGEPERLKADFNNSHVIGFARDGSLFYEVTVAETDVYLAGLDPATGKLTSEPKRVNESQTNSLGHVAWLPDGKSLSFYNKSPVFTLMVHTLSTREEREVWGGKTGRTGGYYTGWFPDGVSLMWEGGSGQTIVFRRMDSRTGEVQATWTVPAVPSGSASNVFSPDLMTMFFEQKDGAVPCEGTKCTYIMLARSLETGRDREIFRIGGMMRPRNASVSSDGGEIAFIAGDGAEQHVMVAPTAGGPPREIYRYRTTEGMFFFGTTWTPDGGHVLALHRLPAAGEVWSFSTKGGSPEKSPLHMRPSGVPAVSPDGTQIAFNGGSSRSEIWVMTGLFQDTKSATGR